MSPRTAPFRRGSDGTARSGCRVRPTGRTTPSRSPGSGRAAPRRGDGIASRQPASLTTVVSRIALDMPRHRPPARPEAGRSCRRKVRGTPVLPAAGRSGPAPAGGPGVPGRRAGSRPHIRRRGPRPDAGTAQATAPRRMRAPRDSGGRPGGPRQEPSSAGREAGVRPHGHRRGRTGSARARSAATRTGRGGWSRRCGAGSVLAEGPGHRQTVLVDVVADDQPVLDGEVQREPGAVGAPRHQGRLADLAEDDGVGAVH